MNTKQHKCVLKSAYIDCPVFQWEENPLRLTVKRGLSFIYNLTVFLCFYTRATVSRQIASSSFVGITATFTLESGVEITISSPLCPFASLSSVTPR